MPPASYKKYLRLAFFHGRLFKQAYCFDFIFLCLGSIYLCLPLSSLALTLKNAALLVLLIIFFVVYHLYVIKNNTGGLFFYLLLPCNHATALCGLLAVALVPFVLAWLLLTMGLIVFGTVIDLGIPSSTMLARAGHILFLFILCKTLPLPLLALNRRHPALIVLFFLSFIPFGLVISILHEVLFSQLSDPFPVLAAIFLGQVLILEWIIIKTLKV